MWLILANTDRKTVKIYKKRQIWVITQTKQHQYHWGINRWFVTFGFSSCQLWNVLQFKVTCCWGVVVGNGLTGWSVILLLLEWWCQCPWWATHQRRMLTIAEDNLWTTITKKWTRKLEVKLWQTVRTAVLLMSFKPICTSIGKGSTQTRGFQICFAWSEKGSSNCTFTKYLWEEKIKPIFPQPFYC